ncbi:hypothetical protein RCL1_001974 [Eukaryota sp. TZLM3-RCL]
MSEVLQLPFIHGNCSSLLTGQKGPNTHRWYLYVRSSTVPLHLFLDKVRFLLHPEFPDPIREVTSPPFQVSDCGWGEFSVVIELYVFGIREPLKVHHYLKLWPSSVLSKLPKNYASEQLDFIIFKTPTPEITERIQSILATSAVDNYLPGLPNLYYDFAPEKLIKKITSVGDRLTQRLEEARSTSVTLEESLKDEEAKLEELQTRYLHFLK